MPPKAKTAGARGARSHARCADAGVSPARLIATPPAPLRRYVARIAGVRGSCLCR